MADIFEYLEWRADVPLSVAPFNDVDNLVLSELAYTDFTGIVSRDPVPLPTVHERFFASHSREELAANTSFTAKAPLLMDPMVAGCRFGTMRVCHYVSELDAEKTAQMSATTFLLDDGTAYVAFRGTDSTLIGWREDFDIGCLTETSGQQNAVAYLEKVAADLDVPLRVGGHSKGGNFAEYAASFCSAGTQARIIAVYSNDAPGFRNELLELPGFLHILPKIVRIVPDTSIIGMLLSHKSRFKVIKSTAFGILQHDGFSWNVKRDGFVEAELSNTGKFFDQILDSWIDGMDDQTRTSVTDTIFSIFESTGADTFHEMSQQKWKSAEAMFSSLFKMPSDKQAELIKLTGNLLKKGGQAILDQLPDRLLSWKNHEQDPSPAAERDD